jgi:DNA-binding protein WhiA
MSFSAEIRSELSNTITAGRHCHLAELAAIIYFCGKISISQTGQLEISIFTENEAAKRKYFTLLAKAFTIEADAEKVLKATRIIRLNDESSMPGPSDTYPGKAIEKMHDLSEGISSLLLKKNCCRRAYLRGAFICAGSMSNPQGGYHLEFVLSFEKQAKQIKEILNNFELEAKIIRRKKYYIVYLKEGAGIVDLLNIMGAHNALLNLENLRVEKEVRNSINRQVNCEAANISKMISAAARQIEDITYIKEHYGFEILPDNLRQLAEIRLEYPDIPMQELGDLLNPPLGKSGVNHRLRKLSELRRKA